MQVVDADCRPLAGARVDIWHCDAQGAYSGYPDRVTAATSTRRARPSCVVGRRPMQAASFPSPPSIPAGIAAAPPISISRSSPTTIR
ncbi:hypothetical protein [Mesorhizobium sp. M7A.F.Ca.US.011.01.1.1]|uniref:dioxygenase family protein n=1 Tax=Mesorhizobium sp. M7A.F.Ca.US.011.01.1.1 TaxID=2496741 RepID=UPI0032AE9E50